MLIEQNLFGTTDKVADAIRLLQAHEPPEGYYLCFSGGKDSVVIKELARLSGVKFDAHYNVTTVDPPPVESFIRKYHPDVIWDYPKFSMAELIVKYKIPPLRQCRYCCAALKKCHGKGRVKVAGIRASESRSRAKRQLVDNVNGVKHVNPILNWSTADVWAFIRNNRLPYCELYDLGFDRIGCVLCPFESAARQRLDLHFFPEIVERYRRACQLSFQLNREKFSHRHRSGDDLFTWWLSRCADGNPEILSQGGLMMDNLFTTEQAAEKANLKYKTFHSRARNAGIEPAEFVPSPHGGKPQPRWTQAQVTEIKNLVGNKRTAQPSIYETDGSEEDQDEEDFIAVIPAEDDDLEDELIDPPEPAQVIIIAPPAEVVSLEERANKIRALAANVQHGIVQIGFELIAAKEQVGHGNWGAWLQNEFEWTQRTANNFMRIAERFGKLENVFQFQTSTLQAMLALPAGEEQAFIDAQAAAGKPVETQSAREVQANVKDWKQRSAAEKDNPSAIVTAGHLPVKDKPTAEFKQILALRKLIEKTSNPLELKRLRDDIEDILSLVDAQLHLNKESVLDAD